MLDNDAIRTIVIGAVFAVAVISWNARWAFEAWAERNRPATADVDEVIAEEIKRSTREIVGVLGEIRNSNAYLEQSERDYNQREGYADEAPGTSIHRMFTDETDLTNWADFEAPKLREAWTWPRQYGKSAAANEWIRRYAMRPQGFRPAPTPPSMWVEDDIEPAVDLTKHVEPDA